MGARNCTLNVTANRFLNIDWDFDGHGLLVVRPYQDGDFGKRAAQQQEGVKRYHLEAISRLRKVAAQN